MEAGSAKWTLTGPGKRAEGLKSEAPDTSFVIVMEKLKHIRRSKRKGNGNGRSIRRRINRWPFSMLQQATEYKAAWAGVAVEYAKEMLRVRESEPQTRSGEGVAMRLWCRT